MSFEGMTLYSLPTPCGSVTVTDPEGGYVPFFVGRNFFAPVFESCSGHLHYARHSYVIHICTRHLRKGQVYSIRLEGTALSVGSADECTESVSGVHDGHAIAIGAIDHNVYEKLEQGAAFARQHGTVSPPKDAIPYDRSGFRRYDTARLPDCSGFSFELLDEDWEEIVFPVCWQEDLHGEGRSAAEFRVI